MTSKNREQGRGTFNMFVAPRWRPILDPNRAMLPDASLVDFSFLLEPPAGKHGFVKAGTDGNLYFEDGGLARFTGADLVGKQAMREAGRVELYADAMARAGMNLARIHIIDYPPNHAWGRTIIDEEHYDDTGHLDPEAVDRVDYFVHVLKQRGIYVWFPLLEYRRFRPGDGVVNAEGIERDAAGYCVFDRRMIDLQKEYATARLTHMNPYTGLAYAEDPGVAFVQLLNENTLYWREHFYGEIDIEPYRTEYFRLWEAWAEKEGCRPGERKEAFFDYLHARYMEEMRDHLLALGCKPLIVCDDWGTAAARTLGSMVLNTYHDYPLPDDRKRPVQHFRFPGLGDFAQAAIVNRAPEVPLLYREWNALWPTPYRSTFFMEMPAFARFNNISALSIHTFAPEGHFDDTSTSLWYGAVPSDPTRWGLFPVGAKLFYREDVQEKDWWRDEAARRAYLNTAYTKGIAGEIRGAHRAGEFTVRSASQRGAVVATSLDDHPLSPDSARFILKMVTESRAKGVVTRRLPKEVRRDGATFVGYRTHRLKKKPKGDAIQTLGKRSKRATEVRLDGEVLVRVFMEDGTWELARLDSEVRLYCDTPGVTFEIPWLSNRLTLVRYGYRGEVVKSLVANRFRYPRDARYIALFEGSGGLGNGA